MYVCFIDDNIILLDNDLEVKNTGVYSIDSYDDYEEDYDPNKDYGSYYDYDYDKAKEYSEDYDDEDYDYDYDAIKDYDGQEVNVEDYSAKPDENLEVWILMITLGLQ